MLWAQHTHSLKETGLIVIKNCQMPVADEIHKHYEILLHKTLQNQALCCAGTARLLLHDSPMLMKRTGLSV